MNRSALLLAMGALGCDPTDFAGSVALRSYRQVAITGRVLVERNRTINPDVSVGFEHPVDHGPGVHHYGAWPFPTIVSTESAVPERCRGHSEWAATRVDAMWMSN